MPWAKGQSGNPGGRASGRSLIETLAREHSVLAITTLAEIAADPQQKGVARVKASEALLARGWGAPRQDIEVTGADGESLTIHYVVRAPMPVESAKEWIQTYAPPVPQLTDS